MRKTTMAVAALLTALLTLTFASTAHAYDAPVPVPDEGSNVFEPGETGTVTGDFGRTVDFYTATFLGEQVGAGESTETWEATITAPEEPGTYPLTIDYTYDEEIASSASGLSQGFVPAAVDDTATVQIIVRGEGDGAGAGSGDDDSALPDTGGSSLWLFAGGAALVLLGAALVARRRNA